MKSVWKKKVRKNQKEKYLGLPKALAINIPEEVYLVLENGVLFVLTPEQAQERGLLKNFER